MQQESKSTCVQQPVNLTSDLNATETSFSHDASAQQWQLTAVSLTKVERQGANSDPHEKLHGSTDEVAHTLTHMFFYSHCSRG